MTKQLWIRLLAVFLTFGLIAAACGDDDVSTEPAPAEAPAEQPAEQPAEAGADLAAVCPSPLIIQSDWFPESEHGALYEIIGDDYVVDVDQKVVRGSMVSGGEQTGIDVEVRTGGPAIGFAPVSSHMYTDDGIHLGYASTDDQVAQFSDAPLYSVLAPLEKNPQMVMWDPATYPNVETLADLGEEGVTVNIFTADGWPAVMVALGVWTEDQIDPSYDGGPARFITEDGAIAQQGFASAEIFTYENVFEEWGRPLNFQLIHDAGFEVYSQTVAIRPDDLEELRPCLEQVVPIIQQAQVDFINAPARTNAMIIDAVEKYADFWVYDQPLADYSVATQLDLGLVGNGPDSTLGNMEADRIQTVIDQMRDAGMDVSADLTAADLHTNEFIDQSIGL